jgi:dynactin-5
MNCSKIPFIRGAFYPLQVGDNVIIGDNTIVNASAIGSYVYIGKNCIIVSLDSWAYYDLIFHLLQSRSCILKDCCRIEDGTVLPPETVVAPFTVFGGSPGSQVGELASSTQDLMIETTRSYYHHFKPMKKM